MRGILEPDHLLLILLVVLVLFGGKKIPELAAGLGKGVREFKRGLHDPTDAAALSAPSGELVSPVAPQAPVAEPSGPKRLLG